MPEQTAAEISKETLQRYRDIVSAVVGFVRGQEITKAFTSISLEELIDRRIDRIEAPAAAGKPGGLTRLTKLKADFDSAIEGIKSTPPDSFRSQDPTTDANTSDASTSTTATTGATP